MKHYKQLTNEEARAWLIEHDKEAADFWRDSKADDLAESVGENLRDFGNSDELQYDEHHPHSRNDVRELVYHGYSYPVIYQLQRNNLDDEACFVCEDAEWELSDDDLIELLIREGVALQNHGDIYEEGELYDIEVHCKGSVILAVAYVQDGQWFAQGTNTELNGRIVVVETEKPRKITREEFLAYFRSDAYSEELSADDCIEVFSTALKGSSDITYALLEAVCSDYDVNLNDLVQNQGV